MNKYAYVVCYKDGNKYAAFKHTFVTAKSSADAYHKGGKWFDLQPEFKNRTALNDYTIRL